MKTVRVAAAVICRGNKIFATARGYGAYKGRWEFPGGKIEEGETSQEALQREIEEELDVRIRVQERLEVIEYDYPEFHLSMDCFRCEIVSGNLFLREAEAARWLLTDQLDQVSWLPADQILVDQLKTGCAGVNPKEKQKLTPESPEKYMKIWEDRYCEKATSIRIGCRGIFLEAGKVLLSYESRKGWYFLPGGGLEKGETPEEGCVREIEEEAGILGEVIAPVITVGEHYYDRLFESHFFFCERKGRTSQNLTLEEEKNGMVPCWVPLEEAIRIFSTYPMYSSKHEALCGSYLRDYQVLCYVQQCLQQT